MLRPIYTTLWWDTEACLSGKQNLQMHQYSGVPRGGECGGGSNSPEILKALQNRAKLNPIVKIVKNCWI